MLAYKLQDKLSPQTNEKIFFSIKRNIKKFLIKYLDNIIACMRVQSWYVGGYGKLIANIQLEWPYASILLFAFAFLFSKNYASKISAPLILL